jgi:hypothetical protein
MLILRSADILFSKHVSECNLELDKRHHITSDEKKLKSNEAKKSRI